MMTGKEKLYFLLDAIIDARAIAPSGQPLIIDPTNDLNRKFRDIELKQLFIKLENDEKILKVLQIPNISTASIDIVEDFDPYDQPASNNDGCWHIELLPAFDPYFLHIQQEPEYQGFTGKLPPIQVRPKLSRKSLEKIWTILQEIEDKRGIALTGEDIAIQQAHLSKTHNGIDAKVASDERLKILKKLEREDGAIKDVRWPKGFHQFGYLKIGDRYFEVYDYYEKEYKNVATDYQQSQQPKEISTENPAYEVKYSEKARKILINNFLLKQPRSFSDNEAIFVYLYKNPNQDKSVDDIKQGTGLASIRDLNKFVENIGFVGDVRKAFFKVSKNTIRFNNPITKEDLKELGIDYLKLG